MANPEARSRVLAAILDDLAGLSETLPTLTTNQLNCHDPVCKSSGRQLPTGDMINAENIDSHLDLEGRKVVGVRESDLCYASAIQVRNVCSFREQHD